MVFFLKHSSEIANLYEWGTGGAMFLAIERLSERKNESVSERVSTGIGTARISKNLAARILVNSLCSLCIKVARGTKMMAGSSRVIGTARINENLAARILVNSLCSLCVKVVRRTKMRPGGLPGGSGQQNQ